MGTPRNKKRAGINSKYSESQIRSAIDAVVSGMQIVKAAKLFQMSEASLHYHCAKIGIRKVDQNLNRKSRGVDWKRTGLVQAKIVD